MYINICYNNDNYNKIFINDTKKREVNAKKLIEGIQRR